MAKVKGTYTLTDTETTVTVEGLDANAQVTLDVHYVDEDGDPSFGINGYATTDSRGKFSVTLPLGRTQVEAVTGKDIDYVDVDGETNKTFHGQSQPD